MKRRRPHRLLAAVLFVACAAAPASAWESQTTHAGLAEQAALSSSLHTRLVELGFTGGLYEPLTVPPADAPALMESLGQYAPVHGFVPDRRGRQFAIGWLAAGAVLADSTPGWAVNHFFDPTTGRGAHLDQGFAARLRETVEETLGRGDVPERGVAAVDWIAAKDNPLGLAGFRDQYAKAVRAGTPAERARHLAGALIAAGAVLHVLQDMASPSHVRDDLASHLEKLGPARDDLGSRFERVAALAYGRLGVPTATAVARPSVRAFFTDADGKGLADRTAAGYFSSRTLPRAVGLGDERDAADRTARIARALVKPAPVVGDVKRIAATTDEGATLDDARGTCLLRYRHDKDTLRFSTDDDCLLEQVDALLPEAVGYGAGLLDFLFRGDLEVTIDPSAVQSAIVVARGDHGAGRVEVLAEDARGVRTAVGAPTEVAAGKAGDPIGTVALPGDASAVYVLFDGVDAAGEPMLAVGRLRAEDAR